MPSDLDQLAQDADHQNRWGTPPTGNGLQDLASQRQMTHQPEQPNPATPYLQGVRDFASRAFVDPLRATGFLPQAQPPSWYGPAREVAGQLFREGPAPMMAGMFPRGGLSQLAAQSGYLPQWVDDNPITHALRSPAFMQATQFFTPLVGALGLVRVPNRTNVWGKDQYSLIHKETGEKRGDVWLDFNPQTKNLKVGYFQAEGKKSNTGPDPRQWALGKNPIDAALELRSALPEAWNFYPGMKTIEFLGVGGAKGKNDMSARLKFEVTRTPDGQVEWKKIRHDPLGYQTMPASESPTRSGWSEMVQSFRR